MARVRINDSPAPRNGGRRPMPLRQSPPRPVRARQPQYEEDYDEPEEGQIPYDDEPEERPILRTRAPVHGARVRGHRESQHETDHGPARRVRRRKATAVEDIFYIPVEEIPEGSSYEWKRYSVVGQEDPFYLAQMREQGWEPVDPRRHPNWLPPGYSQPHIIKGGMILMERPIELTEEARAEQKVLARQQVREAEARLGRTPGNTHQRLAPKITKEIMRQVPVAEE